MMANSKRQQGFTLVELMFAMVFIAFILLFTTVSVIELVRQYNRGVETKVINQSGRSIVDLMSRDIGRSGSLELYGTETGVGMLCTDTAVYAWNGINAPTDLADRNTYRSNQFVPLSFVRINDRGACQMTTDLAATPTPLVAGRSNIIPYPYGLTDQNLTSELLSRQAQVLSVRIVEITPRLYRLHVALGTSRPDAYTDEGGVKVCKPAQKSDVCAKADFSTTVYMP